MAKFSNGISTRQQTTFVFSSLFFILDIILSTQIMYFLIFFILNHDTTRQLSYLCISYFTFIIMCHHTKSWALVKKLLHPHQLYHQLYLQYLHSLSSSSWWTWSSPSLLYLSDSCLGDIVFSQFYSVKH